jgi:hypothetical protein
VKPSVFSMNSNNTKILQFKNELKEGRKMSMKNAFILYGIWMAKE